MDTNTGKVYEGNEEIEKAKEEGKQVVELPCKPTPDCGKCFGRGAIKSWGTEWIYGACPRCYPEHPKKAVTFKQHLKRVKI